MSNQDIKSLKRSIDDLNRLADFDGAIKSHDLFRTHSRLECSYNVLRQGCQPIAKMDNPSDAVRIVNGALLGRVDKFREQIARKHGLYKPDRPPWGHPSETPSTRKPLDGS